MDDQHTEPELPEAETLTAGAENAATNPSIHPSTRPKGNTSSDADRTRARQALELQRERILSERTSSPHRRSALENALASVEEQLAELGWMLHL